MVITSRGSAGGKEPVFETLSADKISISNNGVYEFTTSQPISELVSFSVISITSSGYVAVVFALCYPMQGPDGIQAGVRAGTTYAYGTPQISGNKVTVSVSGFTAITAPDSASVQYIPA